jgi:hypothetical protein
MSFTNETDLKKAFKVIMGYLHVADYSSITVQCSVGEMTVFAPD